MSKEKLSEKIWEQSSEWIEQVGTVVGDLAKQLGVATEHVYTVYTKQIFFEGVVSASYNAFFMIILLIAIIITWILTRNIDDESKWIARVIVSFVGFGLIALIGDSFVGNLVRVLNPEYYTIKEIIEQVGGMVNND